MNTHKTLDFKDMVDKALVGVYAIQDDYYCYANACFLDIFGYSEEEMKSVRAMDIVYPEDRTIARANMNKLINGESEFITFNLRGVRKDGTLIHFRVKGGRSYFNGRPCAFGTIVDISDQLATEDLLAQSEKLTAVGQLAASIAHEIRNPLTSIKGFIQLLQNTKEYNANYLRIMMGEIDRISLIVNEMLFLAKPQPADYQSHQFQDVVHTVLNFMESEGLMRDIQIHFDHDGNPLSISCDGNKIKQVLINLLKNAFEAMPNGGNIYIQLFPCAGNHISLKIIDEGYGIPDEKLAMLGNPFYTTKQNGTGLGLMVTQKIIGEHKGTITFSSTLNVGTTVEIVLPRA